MDEKIAGDAGAVIAVIAPAEKTLRGPRGAWAHFLEMRPIAGVRARVGGMEYSQAPIAVLRSSHASTELSLPIAFA